MYRFLFLLLVGCYPYLTICQEVQSPFLMARDTILSEGPGGTMPLHAGIIGIGKNQKITGWHLDMPSGGLLLELENNQSFTSGKTYGKTLLMADPDDFSARWDKQIQDPDNAVIQAGDMLFLELKKNTSRLDPSNGNELWKIKKRLYFALPEEKTGFFYPRRLSSKQMSAIDLDTGNEIWETRQNRRYGWDDVFLYDPQTLLIASEGISLYNIRNGEKRAYRAKTSYNDAAGMVLTNVLGFLGGLFWAAISSDDDGGGEFLMVAYQDKVNTSSNIMSNVSIDESGNLYLGSANRIACISDKGETIWSNKLPKKKTSKSALFLHNGNAFLLNRGYANYNSRPAPMGEAYLASFDMQTGKKRYLEKIYTEKFETVDNFQVIGDILFVIIDKRVQTYDLTDGSFTGELIIDRINLLSGGSWFIDGGIYVKDSTGCFRDIMDVDPELVHVMTAQGDIFSLDGSLAKIKMYGSNDAYSFYLRANGFTFLHHKGATLVLHGQTPVAELPFEADGFLAPGNIFYHIDQDRIWKIDLDRYTESLSPVE